MHGDVLIIRRFLTLILPLILKKLGKLLPHLFILLPYMSPRLCLSSSARATLTLFTVIMLDTLDQLSVLLGYDFNYT
jgi:hypothetical protein